MNIIKMKLAQKGGDGSGGSGEEIVAYPWEVSHENGTDMFGEYTVNTSPTAEEAKSGDAVFAHVKFMKLNDDKCRIAVPFDFGDRPRTSYDLTFLPEDYILRSPVIAEPYDNGKILCIFTIASVARIKFPEKYAFKNGVLGQTPAYTFLPKKIALDGVYKYTVNGVAWSTSLKMTSMWVAAATTTFEKNVVKCPKDAEIPYYLNKFPLITAEDMVEIFENMIDRSGETTTATITLGTDNLAKLTDEQKNIALAKGWNLA